MTAAIFGLLGVLLGSLLSGAKDWWLQRLNRRREANYLAVLVVGLLDRYVFACAAVVADDGLSNGLRDENGYLRPQVKLPKFEPDALKVDWKSIPLGIMYELLDLPYKGELANHAIEAAWEYTSAPPDFEEVFEARHEQYSKLGIHAASLAARLRAHSGLPERESTEWDPVAFLKEKQAEFEAQKSERQRRWERAEMAADSNVASNG